MIDGLPDIQPLTTLKGAGLQIVDMEVAPNGAVFVLQSTNLTIYTMDEWTETLNYTSTFPLDPRSNYLSVDVVVDFRFPQSGTFTVLLSTTSSKANIEEYVMISGHTPIPTGYYTIPTNLIYVGDPPVIDINSKFVVVHAVETAYVFKRGIPDLIASEYKQFYETTVLF